ncbi:MAG: hypothetical protein B655_1398 [Methanobacterium sp. Maddingley MBC34]|nr:MAG: hypothetical protein B655_1398 [Methanobacterium sp. Maddingley MBC34]
MSLIITYVGKKGCVMAGDKRSIGFLGDRKQRELLEEELYAGKIKTTEDLHKRAEQLDINLKITDNVEKVRNLGEVLVGEVKLRTTLETRRKRIYGTSSGYHQVELTGSEIRKVQSGQSSIVVFGNKITKEIANKHLKKYWKSKTSLDEVGKIFRRIMEDVAQATPSVSQQYDIFIIHPQLNHKQAMELLRTTIVGDVKELEKWREKLKQEMLEKTRDIQMASRILTQGEVGRVRKVEGDEVEVILSPGVEALNTRWDTLASEGETIIMKMETPTPLNLGDMVVIEDENLCIKKDKTSLSCDIILCKSS